MLRGISVFVVFIIFFYFSYIFPSDSSGTLYDYVGKNQRDIDFGGNNSNSKVMVGKGEYLYLREDFFSKNATEFKALITIFDYDQSSFAVHWLPPECNQNGDVIQCHRPRLSLNQSHSVYFILKPLTSINYGKVLLGKSSATISTDNERYIVIKGNSIYVNVIEKASCGEAARFFSSFENSYPMETKFCTNGISYPSSPIFPTMKATINWTCQSDLGNVDCSASRGYPKVDYLLNKYVGYNKVDVENNKIAIKVNFGDEIVFKLSYANLQISEDTPKNCLLVDYVDKRFFELIDYPNKCNINGNKLSCRCATLQPHQNHMIYYRVRVKKDFHHHVLLEVKSIIDVDNEVNYKNNFSSVKIEIN